MQNNVESDFQSQLDAVFVQLNPQAVEEFYAAYQEWSLQQRMAELRQRIEMVHTQQAENEQRLREAQPSAIALAALARLQSNGVSDIALLDAMLERGESWLDQTMQRLDYFEQFDDFISDDYTKWCQGALEGAFDWIDSLREDREQSAPAQTETPPAQSPSNSEDAAEVEALLLQRLATEHEDDLVWQEAITLKRPAIQPQASEITTDESEEQYLSVPEDGAQPDAETQAQIAEYIPQDEPAPNDETANDSNAADPAGAEEQIIPEEASPVEDSALSASEPDQPALIEFAPLEETTPDEDEPHAADDQPPLIESAPVDEPPVAGDELYEGDEQPTFVEFAAPAPSEVSPPEETSDQETEQAEPSEVPVPEDIPVDEDTAHREAYEPQEMEYSAPEETAPYEEEAPSSNQASRYTQSTPRKAGLIRGLIRLITGI
ncbi:MAG TPA: hypothetical protein VIZ18_02705 [Ktedonobacteraceae bacterium]